ncbi:1-aminocyclopropane-1-carboxylate oxidase-like [Bradysia coprophila]|uniref:1-aminocyclopropane-1-carboxylate oxidase-like n=1 Tax=Bradysia coprophila TaxID=38358 RepID=UPI00187D8DC9|nr:1-aminocyclopropane-1-carboxylate oxidase-like [Bradysia coprophila]
MVHKCPEKLSWCTQDSMLCKQLVELDEGICLFEDVGLEAPMQSIKNTFRKIYGDPQLSQRLNDVYPARGIFKDVSQKSLQNVDQKVPFDLSPARLRAIVENDTELVHDLGDDFRDILTFYSNVQDKIIPRLIRLAETAINNGSDMNIHQQMNYNYRLVDYYPVHSKSRRCGEHRDYGTFTLIFQDGSVGGLEVFSNGSWLPIPPTVGVVFLWGWSAAILSNGIIKAPLHRVVTTRTDGREVFASRRNAAVFFVAPDLDVKLNPKVRPDEVLAFNFEAVKDLTVGDFKALMGKKWRHREGTLTAEEQADIVGKVASPQSQDDEIIAFLKKI